MRIRLKIASMMLTLIMIINLACSCTLELEFGIGPDGAESGSEGGNTDTGGSGTTDGEGGNDSGDAGTSDGSDSSNSGTNSGSNGGTNGGSDGTGDSSGDDGDYVLSVDLAMSDRISVPIGERAKVVLSTHGSGHTHEWRSTSSAITVNDGLVYASGEGSAIITLICEHGCDSVFVQVERDGVAIGSKDPYSGIKKEDFYKNYLPAYSHAEATYRSLAELMTGEIGKQDQRPTVSSDRPVGQSGKYIKNSEMLYSQNRLEYYLTDSTGEVVRVIYKGGGYIMLEEVAAHIFAFGTLPANYVASKSMKPTDSIWGEYLRLNHSEFSGSTTKYPYEPKLPRISGCGGDLRYYELDVGTTGTDCDPSYPSRVYNNGTKITRGAARIVYSRTTSSGAAVSKIEDRFLFYTFNHYNDFCEYLNYYGGWGETFGNITGGGTISSKTDYNPTPYVQVELGEIWDEGDVAALVFMRRRYGECA